MVRSRSIEINIVNLYKKSFDRCHCKRDELVQQVLLLCFLINNNKDNKTVQLTGKKKEILLCRHEIVGCVVFFCFILPYLHFLLSICCSYQQV